MFDIREYYQSGLHRPPDATRDLTDIDQDLSCDIDTLLRNRFDRLYIQDRYKYTDHTIEIIYPRISYPGNRNIPLNPDRVRFLLSFYPEKKNLLKIDKLILRPRYIEVGQIELVALYLRARKALVMYLCQPHHYNLHVQPSSDAGQFVSMDLDKLMKQTMGSPASETPSSGMVIHPLWYILSTATQNDETSIDKFFFKNNNPDSAIRKILNDISFFYSDQGY